MVCHVLDHGVATCIVVVRSMQRMLKADAAALLQIASAEALEREHRGSGHVGQCRCELGVPTSLHDPNDALGLANGVVHSHALSVCSQSLEMA